MSEVDEHIAHLAEPQRSQVHKMPNSAAGVSCLNLKKPDAISDEVFGEFVKQSLALMKEQKLLS